eukprot:CAMPEP_0203683338 /NCGR_PEP_ID=MMETSP0090-20130426/47471_1 /ASSEMBLY_ACC=CAM_ASM_001088 /TAXON_ID=426623 /ORGANISM="Chaetoceros affinis, Strain CCMP159" /LENGTH=305 /DNA_ID=CAMNT_0050552481 /DNA_START=1235 /DNA_END=2152 /DNA_ORIENTATION=+
MIEQSHRNTKVVIIQAFAYLGSFVLTLSFPLMRSLTIPLDAGLFTINLLARLSIIVMPLQGFFNALIFISHKIYNYRRVHEDVSRWEILWMLLRGSLDEPMLFSRISQIDIRAGERFVDVELVNEERVEQITVYLNINENDIPSSPASEGMGNLMNNRRQPAEDSESQNLSGFDSSNNRSREQDVEDQPTSFRQPEFSNGSDNPNSNDTENKNTAQLPTSASRDEVSSNSLNRDGLSGFSPSIQNDSNISYDSQNLSGFSGVSSTNSRPSASGGDSRTSAFSRFFRIPRGTSQKSSPNSEGSINI